MSIKSEWAIQRIHRGARVAEIREALDLSGEEFAEVLRKNLLAFGVERRYDKAKISRIEGGSRDLSLEEAAVIAELDPQRRGILWLTFGEIARVDAAKFFKKTARRASSASVDSGGSSAARPRRRSGSSGSGRRRS